MFLPWQARVLRSGPGHWRLPRLCRGFPLVPTCPPHLQMDGSGHARAPSPPPCRLPLPILWTGNWSCRKLQQDWQMNTLHCYKGQRYSSSPYRSAFSFKQPLVFYVIPNCMTYIFYMDRLHVFQCPKLKNVLACVSITFACTSTLHSRQKNSSTCSFY